MDTNEQAPHGYLCDYHTGEVILPATEAEAAETKRLRALGYPYGAFAIDGDGNIITDGEWPRGTFRIVYVSFGGPS